MKTNIKTGLPIAVAICLLAVTSIAQAVDGKWNVDAAGNWSDATKWTNNQIADGVGAIANFSFDITAGRTVTLDSPRTVGRVRFEDVTTSSHEWTLSGNILTLQVTSGSPVIDAANRTPTISSVLAGNQGFTKIGGGTLQLNNYANTYTGATTITNGFLRIKADGSLGPAPDALTADAITLGTGGVLMNYDSEVSLSATRGITLNAGGGKIQAGWSKLLTVNAPVAGTGGLTINSDSTPGVISLNGANSYTGATAVNGWLQLNGSLDAASAVTVASGGLLLGNGTINGSLTVNAGGNIGGGGLYSAGTLTVNNSATLANCMLHVDLSTTPEGANDLLTVNGNLALSGTITVSINPLAGSLTPGTYRLINYTGTLTGGAANLAALPSRYTITFDTSAPGRVNMIVQNGATADLVWNGAAGQNWDVGLTLNWLNGANLDTFYNGDNVLLDDSGNNALPILIVGPSLFNTVVPGSVTVNAAKDYTLGGGRMAGPMTLTKKGTGILTLAAANGSLPNYFDGQVTVEGGRIRAGYGRALGSQTGGTVVRNGASLDVNGQDLGFEPISIEGAGADGQGALVNYGGNQNNALRRVTMTGNATVGGTGRFDIRNLGGNAFLNTGGNSYKLTKRGPNQFSLVGAAVDPALGDVDIQEGTFGFETSSTLGNATNTLNMGIGTSLRLWNLDPTNGFYKPLVLNGGTAANIDNGSGTNTIIGPVTVAAQSIWNIAGTSLAVYSGIQGAGGLTKTAGSALYLYGTSTYPGPTLVSGGSLVLGAAASLSNSTLIELASGTTFDVSAVAAVSPSGSFELNGASGQTLGGSGTVVGNVSAGSGSTISPGTLTFNNDLKIDGASAVFELGATTNVGAGINDLVVVKTNLTLSGNITLRIDAIAPLDTVNPYTIATYGGTLNAATANLSVVSDSRYTFVVDATSTPGAIRVKATAAGTGPETLTWQGNVTGSATLWDIKTTANWSKSLGTPAMFYQGDSVRFDDSAVGATVSLSTTVTPASLVVSNGTKDFTWTGAGNLSGVSGIVKQGAGKLTIANSRVNDNTGSTVISDGTLEVGNGGTTGNLNSAAITNTGTLVFNRSDDITVANAIGGAGTVEKKGAGLLILTTAQPNLTGPVVVSAGTLRAGNATSLGTVAAGTTVTNGATLDVNGQTLGNETITVSGSGVGGAGAIYNSGSSQQNATRNVVLAGNTTFGGANRWDIRASGTPSGLTGNGFNLTKTGPNETWLVNLTETGVGDITINQGTLGIEGTTTMGNVGATLTVNAGATLGFWANNNSASPLNKVVVMNNGTWINNNGDNYFSGPITLNGQNSFNLSATLRLLGPISGQGRFVKDSAGSLYLGAANTYTGDTLVNAGTLVLTGSGSIAASPKIRLAKGAKLDASGRSDGTLALGSGQTLTGNGAVVGTLTVGNGSTVAAGTSVGLLTERVGLLTNTGALLLRGGGKYVVEVIAAGGVAGVGYDSITVSGNIGVLATPADKFIVKLVSLGGAGAAGPVADFDKNTSYSWTIAAGNVTNFDASAFALDTTAFANDLAGGYFFMAGNSLTVGFTNNHAPVASPATYQRVAGLRAKIAIADLLANWTSDLDGDARALVSFDATSTNGVKVTSDGTYLLYDGTGSVADSFGYTIKDVRTGQAAYRPGDTVRTATGTVLLPLAPASTDQTLNITRRSVGGDGNVTINFAGIPNETYWVQAATNLPSNNWLTLSTNAAGSNGLWQFTDLEATNYPSRFYRSYKP